MNTLVKVARYHLVNRLQLLVLPIAITAFTFLVNAAIFAMIGSYQSDNYAGGLLSLYIFFFVVGALTVTRSLPFGLALGLSRRTYYLGTVGCMVVLAAAYAIGSTVLQAVERVTGGWGLSMHFFRVPWILDGAWYVTWLTSFVLLVLAFAYGMWFGLVYRRWNLVGLLTFIASQVLVLLAAAATITWLDSWPEVGSAFTTLSVLGLTGVFAVVASALTLGGFGTIRRVTV